VSLKRELAAAVAIPIVLAVLFLAPPIAFNLLACAVALAALWEFYRLAEKSGHPVAKTVGMVLGANILIVAAFALPARHSDADSFGGRISIGPVRGTEMTLWDPEAGLHAWVWIAWLIAAGLLCSLAPLLAKVTPASALAGAASTLFGIFAVALPATSMLWLRTSGSAASFGPRAVLFLFLIVWGCDSAAYYGGRSFGRRKLAPAVSPNKTWEGTISGAIGATLIGGALGAVWLLPELGSWRGAAAGLVASSAGQAGDLVESLWKRGAGVKDSGVFLPGHGGFYDRIDSLLFAAPALAGFVALCDC
jgi:phosphatidate cytidylyltransferase